MIRNPGHKKTHRNVGFKIMLNLYYQESDS
jgi:hypothetical protein